MEIDFNNPKIRELFTNPLKWAEAFLRNPMDSEKPLRLKSYQSEVLAATRENRRIVLRYGRRMGKTVALCVDTLWWVAASPLVEMMENNLKKQRKIKILIATPYETQIKMIWSMYLSLIQDSPLLEDQLVKVRTSDVHVLEFANGSVIEGYTIGISSSNKGTSLRGLDADVIFIDEMDAIPREIIDEVLMPIWTGHPDCKIRVSSTPTGKRELFFEWCTRSEELGWWHRHHPSWHPDNDRWISNATAKEKGMPLTESTEFQVRSTTPSDAFAREYGAEFGEEYGGVYKHHLINSALVKYGRDIDIADSDIFDPGFSQNPAHKYIIGVDWNSYINGGQVVMLEYCSTPTHVTFFDDDEQHDVTIDFTGKYRLFYRRGIKSQKATQRLTREEIIRLLTQYKIDYVYVDYGAGDTNIEELSLYGRAHPELDLPRKLRVIDSGATTDHWDHVAKQKVKKRNKSLMVNFSVLSLEEHMFILPKEEDQPTRLIGQMRSYRIKNRTARGEFSYEGEDHVLDAFNLAIYGFQQNFGQLITQTFVHKLVTLADPRMADYPQRSMGIDNSPIVSNRFSGNIDPEKEAYYIEKHKPKRTQMPVFGKRAVDFSSGAFGRRSF